MRQWPVGLFEDRVTKGSEIFTGRKSAIDLIGRQGQTLVLFELKKAGNHQAGAVSELLFYASVMRDAIGGDALFKFVSGDPRKNCAIALADISGCTKIRGVLLAKSFHPLIEEPRIFKALNEATKQLYVERPICFETAVITKYPNDGSGDFEFSRAPSTD